MAERQTHQESMPLASSLPTTTPTHNRIMLFLFAGLTVLFLTAAAMTFWVDGLSQVLEGRALRKRASALHDVPQFINLTISETGIAAISTDDLRPFNWQLDTITHDSLNLTRQGEQVAFFVAGDGQTMFFLAEAVTNTITAPAVYQLSLGEGLPMALKEAPVAGRGSDKGMFRQVWEENSTFLPETDGGDPWVGQLLLAPRTLSVPLTNIQPSGGRGSLFISVWSSTASSSNPDHHLQVTLNGRQLADWVWDGVRRTNIRVELPSGLLQPDGRNTLTLTSPGDTSSSGEAVYIDRIELLYEGYLMTGQGQFWFASNASTLSFRNSADNMLLFDVTNRSQPIAVTQFTDSGEEVLFAGSGANARYFALNEDEAIRPLLTSSPVVKQSLRQAERGADYIVIYPDESKFEEILQPLLDYRSEQGLRVTAVPVGQIYSEFGYGQRDAAAIRSFLRYAQANWAAPAPRYVLLAGDASHDIHNYLDAKNENLLPAQLLRLRNGYASSDTWFALAESGVPSLSIGRFPAQTAQQLQIMVAKTLAYEMNGRAGWTQRALFVGEAEPYFEQFSAELSALALQGGYDVNVLQVEESERVHYDLMGTLTKGVGLINYAGHGYVSQWGDGLIFEGNDAVMLANNGHTPIFTTFTCNNGAFTEPGEDSLAEELLWVENGGIVAAIAPTSSVLLPALTPLATLFYEALLQDDVVTVGEALLNAQTAAANDPGLQEAVLVVNLLGDPAMRLQRP